MINEWCFSLQNLGRLKLTHQNIIFKNHKTGRVEQIQSNDIDSVGWQRLADQFGLRIMTKKGDLYRFGGFDDNEEEKLRKFFKKNYDLELNQIDLCLKGWNWGTANFDGSVLSFDIKGSRKAFEVPLHNVTHCTTAKNEVTLEFGTNDDAAISLMEMRFHIPTVDGVDPVQAFMEQVLAKANVIQATGDAIATFKELQCLTPRGRYDIKIFPSFIQLHGKTFDYKIPLSTVLRLFQLPHKDGRQVFFVVSLDPPIRQGQTRYHFLILLFNKEDETLVEIGLSEKEIEDKYDGKLQKEMSGPTIDVLAKLMRILVQRKITIPDTSFCSPKDIPVITASYRASSGFLYPLDRGFIYVHKPPIHIRFEEIASINFARSGGSTRSFDFEVETKSGFVHTFSSIEKEEYSKLFDFVSNKKLRVKNRGTETVETKQVEDDFDDSDLDDEPDAYLHRVKQEGRDRVADGDSDESDESFNPDKVESDDVAEEFDSDASASSSEEDSDEGEKKKKKKVKEKKKEKKKSKKEGKPKKKKDKDAPKRPQSAFFLWLNENREKIKKDNPGISITDLSRKAGEIWKDIKDKSKWEKQAAEAKKQYEKDMADYKALGPSKSSSKEKEKEKEKSEKKSKSSPVKSSGQFKSKEYISSSDDSSSDDDDDKPSKKAKSSKSDDKKETKKKEPKKETKKKAKSSSSSSEEEKESDVSMKSDVESEESESTPDSDEDSD